MCNSFPFGTCNFWEYVACPCASFANSYMCLLNSELGNLPAEVTFKNYLISDSALFWVVVAKKSEPLAKIWESFQIRRQSLCLFYCKSPETMRTCCRIRKAYKTFADSCSFQRYVLNPSKPDLVKIKTLIHSNVSFKQVRRLKFIP